MHKYVLMVLLALLLLPALRAQDLIVPSNLATLNGNTFSVWPFNNGGATYQLYIHRSRLNQWSVATEFTGLGFRLTGGRDTYDQDMDFTQYNITVSESDAVSYAANELASTTYDNNIGPNDVVVRSGPLFIPADEFLGGTNPNPFSYAIDFTTPYIYTPGTDLVITIRHTGSQVPISPSIQQMRVDAQTSSAHITSAVGGSVFTSTSGIFTSATVVKLLTPPAPNVILGSPTGSVSHGSSNPIQDPVATETKVVTYTITNNGSDTLNLDPSPVSTFNNVNCNVTVMQPASLVVPINDSTTFELHITPLVVGAFEVEVEIASDAPRNNPFTFKATGNAASGAWIEVYRGGSFIARGSIDNVQRGNLSAFDRVYGIRNQGTQNLDLTDPVTISNVQGCTVQVTQPNWPVIPQGEELLTLTIKPSAAGNFSFQVTIETNDAARSPYTFTVSGSAEEKSGSSSDDSSGCAIGTNRLPLLGFALLGAIVATRRRRLEHFRS